MDGILNLGNALVLLSFVPLAFFVYTLLNLRKLGIPLSHPRVIVEFSLFLAFLLLGIYLTIS
jgi:hypothetical protein